MTARHVLVVEPDAASRFSLSEVLRFRGYNVDEAVSTEAALESMRGPTRPNVVIFEGTDAASLNNDLPRLLADPVHVVLFTGCELPEQHPARRLATAIVPKPLLDELLFAVDYAAGVRHPAPVSN